MKVRSRSDRGNLLAKNDNLFFFVYHTRRRCSEDRLQKVRNGLALPEVAAAQKKRLIKPAIHTEENSPYASPKEVLSGPSPGMQEYLSLKSFSPDAERKKLRNLPKYFFVSAMKEKYHLMSNELSEPLLISALNSVQQVVRMTERQSQEPQQMTKRKHVFEFEDGVSEMNDDIRRMVDEQYRRQMSEAEQEKKRREAQKWFLKAPEPPKQVPPVFIPAPHAKPDRHPLIRELLHLRASSLPETPKRIRRQVKYQTPHESIQENTRIQRTLNRFFTRKNT